MATLQRKRLENTEGNFYVDSSCIDCDTCRWMAPAIFNRQASQSAVYKQPTTDQERLLAMQALLACPTASIGTVDKPTDIKQVQQTFPIPVEDNVYHCGYHSEASYGAASYFIQRPEGNILIDSPRFTPPLVKRLEALGGIKYIYLTHQDDVADHQKFHEHFNCERILHQDDIQPSTQEVEIQLSGTEVVELSSDILTLFCHSPIFPIKKRFSTVTISIN
jgi:ferredoxin